MARINIDDELHADKRFKRLVRKLGSERLAIGTVYDFWRIAQDYWGDEMALMPRAEFDEEGFGPLLEVGLAKDTPDGVYASESEHRFGWYLQRCQASRAGVAARREKAAATQPGNNSGQPGEAPGQSAGDGRSTGMIAPDNPPVPVPAPVPVTAPVTDSSRGAAAATKLECVWTHPAIEEFLSLQPVTIQAQRSWVTKCGGDQIFVETELHKIISNWHSNRETRERYTDPIDGSFDIALCVNRWLTNAMEKRPAAAPTAAASATPKPAETKSAYNHTGASLKIIEQQAEEARANPADPDRVRKLVAKITGRISPVEGH